MSKSTQNSNEEPSTSKEQGLAILECSSHSQSYYFSGGRAEDIVVATVANPPKDEESHIADLLAMLPRTVSNASATSGDAEQTPTLIVHNFENYQPVPLPERNEAHQENSEDMLYNLSDDFPKLPQGITSSQNRAGPARLSEEHSSLEGTHVRGDEKGSKPSLGSLPARANLSRLDLGTGSGRGAVRRRRILYTMTVQEFG